jgi:hypothetical protein
MLAEYKGSQAREVLITMEEYEQIREQMESDAEAGFADLAEDNEEVREKVYATEGQQGYISTAADEDADE